MCNGHKSIKCVNIVIVMIYRRKWLSSILLLISFIIWSLLLLRILNGVGSVEMISSYQMAPPKPFDFSCTDEWPRWIRWFEHFRQASRLVEKWGEPSEYTNLYDGRCGWWYFSSLHAPRQRQEEIRVSKGQIWEKFREGKETVDLFITAHYNMASTALYITT